MRKCVRGLMFLSLLPGSAKSVGVAVPRIRGRLSLIHVTEEKGDILNYCKADDPGAELRGRPGSIEVSKGELSRVGGLWSSFRFMPRTARASARGVCDHAINRGNGWAEVFHDAGDYASFLNLMAAGCDRLAMPSMLSGILSSARRGGPGNEGRC